MWFLPACFAFMAGVNLTVPVGDTKSVHIYGLSMREYHLPVFKVS